MSRYVSMIILIVCMSTAANAQWRIGLKVGTGITDLYAPSLPNMNKAQMVATGGLVADYAPRHWLSLGTGLEILPRGWASRTYKGTPDGGRVLEGASRDLYYKLQVPLVIRLTPGQRTHKPYILLGGAAEANLGGTHFLKFQGAKNREPALFDIPAWAMSYTVGVGRQFILTQQYFLQTEVVFNYDVTNQFAYTGLSFNVLKTIR